MALVEMIMPKMGESVMEGTILKWLKQPGDKIEEDEAVLEVATDKVDTEVPAPFSGVLQEILANEGDVVEVDKPIARILTESKTSIEDGPVEEEEKLVMAEAPQPEMEMANGVGNFDKSEASRFYSPLVMNIAKKENITIKELELVPGTGNGGRVTKNDILNYVSSRQGGTVGTERELQSISTQTPNENKNIQPVVAQAPTEARTKSLNGHDEIIEMDRMRKMIADRMVESKRIAPHVTSFVEADLTTVFDWRSREKRAFSEREGSNLTFTPIFIQAIVKAIKDFPMINISVKEDKIIVKKDINIGMAVALPNGNLIVPVIKNADHYNLSGLALKVNDLAERARLNQLKPDELTGGTYTISNVGTFGNVMGTPILVQPQVGIMAFGTIKKKPAVIETPQGDFIGIRKMMFLSHSYDHRVVDGSLGGMFVRKVADYLEQFDDTQKI
ncbi:dihydrolipoamide acetyltransferase family protein [Flexithrix dorotheae]|uniref:dihydrolipoamide acetyltransferase family protein n=1 Tax=Flexithrix dorotheae TaxID=70993 RepID=UPI00036015D5|nr:dihydrolipoamide acetyltransferase family protein [Flexithrix dorotheae]